MVDICCLCTLRKREALDIVQEILNRLSAPAKATDNNVLVETCPARAWPSATQPVEQVAVVHEIFAREVWLVYEWSPAVPSLEVEQTITIKHELIVTIADSVRT
jgi:hypothetical protein